jgi:hypothetical protein
MSMIDNKEWETLLTLPETDNHMVQVYQDQQFLTDAVCRFICAGLQQNDAIIVVATKEHRDAFEARLDLDGFSVQNAIQRQQLTFMDVHRVIASVMNGDMPDWNAFQKQTQTVFERIPAKYSSIRAFGEVCDILWQGGQYDAADRMEEFWNLVAKPKPVSIFCSYFANHLDPKLYNGQFQCICQHHSHLVAAPDYDKLASAVDEASREILGSSMADILESLASGQSLHTEMPHAQASLFYLSEHMPMTAAKIMNRVQDLAYGCRTF